MGTNPKEKQREYSRAHRERHPEKVKIQGRIAKQRFVDGHRARGLCIECNNPVENGQSRCEQCLARRQTRKLKRIAQGQCRDCSEIAISGNCFCQKCYLKSVSRKYLGTAKRWHELLELFEKQNRICALSGLPLTLGINTDLDHIIPKSRGGDNDLSNLQWVLASINNAKSGMLEAEFFALIEAVYLYMRNRVSP